MGDYIKTCSDILNAIGGKENISSITHCATRLRIELIDKQKYNVDDVNKIDNVLGSFYNTGQLQIIFGPKVLDVYKTMISLTGLQGTIKQESTTSSSIPVKRQKNLFMAAIKTIPACIMPILHIFIGCGLILALLNVVMIICQQGFGINITGSSWYKLFQGIGGLCTNFLVLYVCVSAAKLWNVNVFLAMAVGLFLCVGPELGTLIPGWAEYNKNPITGALPYTASIFTGIISIKLCSLIEHWLDKRVSDNWKMFVIGLPCIVLTILFSVLFFGPIMHWLEYGLGKLTEWLSWPGLYGFGIAILAFLAAPIVITGIHQVFIPLILQETINSGGENINAGHSLLTIFFIASNIAQGCAAIGVAITTKDKKIRNLGWSSGTMALLGITEPAMFGVNLRNKKSFFCAMIGSFIGAWFMGFMRVAQIGMVPISPSVLNLLFTMPNELTVPWDIYDPFNVPTYINLIWMIIGILITMCVTLVLTLIFSRVKKINSQKKETALSRKMKQFNNWMHVTYQKASNSKFSQKYREFKNNIYIFFTKDRKKEKKQKKLASENTKK